MDERRQSNRVQDKIGHQWKALCKALKSQSKKHVPFVAFDVA